MSDGLWPDQSFFRQQAEARFNRQFNAPDSEANRLQRATESMYGAPNPSTPQRRLSPVDRFSLAAERRHPLSGERLPSSPVQGIGSHLPGSHNLFIRQGMDLTISHVASGLQVAFPAFLELISDAYTCDWDEELSLIHI